MTEGSSDNGHPVEQTQQHSQTNNTQRCFVKGLISWITGFFCPFQMQEFDVATTDFMSKPRIYTGRQVATQHGTKTVYCTVSNQNVLNPHVVFRSF